LLLAEWLCPPAEAVLLLWVCALVEWEVTDIELVWPEVLRRELVDDRPVVAAVACVIEPVRPLKAEPGDDVRPGAPRTEEVGVRAPAAEGFVVLALVWLKVLVSPPLTPLPPIAAVNAPVSAPVVGEAGELDRVAPVGGAVAACVAPSTLARLPLAGAVDGPVGAPVAGNAEAAEVTPLTAPVRPEVTPLTAPVRPEVTPLTAPVAPEVTPPTAPVTPEVTPVAPLTVVAGVPRLAGAPGVPVSAGTPVGAVMGPPSRADGGAEFPTVRTGASKEAGTNATGTPN
jgi:hypothetical protein